MAAATTAALIGLAVAGVGATGGYLANSALETSRSAKNKQKALEAARADELAKEAAAREAAQQEAATVGRRAGRSSSIFAAGFGFGSGNSRAGLGSGNLFGN